MEYIGEQLLPGRLGHFFVVLSFVAALTATFSYFMSAQRRHLPETEAWRNLGRFSFLIHGLATFGVIASLFFILVKKRYEYEYAWANVSDDLPVRYVFSAFWKEQQGSFLLWSFWHIVLALVLMLRAGKWESPVLTVVALAETFIASMVLGLYFGDFRLGASPFDLLRDTMGDAPIFAQADYLSQIKGNGLNPTLQNYWMTIHPPTLFLGFASTVVPFAFAIAGLWTREHKEWLRPALQWSLFSGTILGTGILMGGAWAYEALSFGGYWAWDPVENTSLVPWITLVAGIHANLIARSTGFSIRSTYAMYLLTFLLILYSTYLTRSGVLGDSSVHAFTEMGLGFQLLLFIFTFSGLGLWLWLARYKSVPEIKGEEAGTSREFWMFIGSLVLMFSAILITGATSLPVWNKIVQLFDPNYVGAALKDPVEHHNRYQLWIAVFIGLLSGIGQFMRYNERNWAAYRKTFMLHMGIALIGAAALTALNATWIEVHAWQLYAMLFAGMFAVVSNLDYLISRLRGNLKLAGSAVSHFGFGVLVLGILSTGLNKRWISSNTFAMEGLIEGLDGEALNRNVMLMKDAAMPIQDDFEVIYEKDTVERQTRAFTVRFRKRDKNGTDTGEEFVLTPNVMYNRAFTEVVASNPSTQHYLGYDIFTNITSLPKAELDTAYARQQEDSLKYVLYRAIPGDTIFTKKQYIVVEGVNKQPKHPDYHAEKGDIAVGLELSVRGLEDAKAYKAVPIIYFRPNKGAFSIPAFVGPQQMRIKLSAAALEAILRSDSELKYKEFDLKEGGEFTFDGHRVLFAKVEREAKNPNYTAEAGDIAVGARLEVTAPDGKQASAAPVYLIRGNQPFSLKDEIPGMGLHFQFARIEPQTGTLTIAAAKSGAEQNGVPVEIAENAPRSDYIVLEAIVFPGINLVWIGCISMLLGLAIGLWRRLTVI
jgi:cytochrome c-type biogenesis protein CcmF